MPRGRGAVAGARTPRSAVLWEMDLVYQVKWTPFCSCVSLLGFWARSKIFTIINLNHFIKSETKILSKGRRVLGLPTLLIWISDIWFYDFSSQLPSTCSSSGFCYVIRRLARTLCWPHREKKKLATLGLNIPRRWTQVLRGMWCYYSAPFS